jgi:hypothetical protein
MSQLTEETDSCAKYLDEVLSSLLKRYRWLEGKASIYSDDEEKVQRLTNTQQRVAKSICDCVELMKNPRLNLSGEGDDDLAKLIARVKESVQEG